MKYSETKFKSFTPEKKQKILKHFIKEIHNNWDDSKQRSNLLLEFSKCLKWMGIPISVDLYNSSIRGFLEFAVPLERRMGQELADFEILRSDGSQSMKTKQPFYLILDNLRSSFNVGSIFRTAECFGVKKLFLCGYTATPENPKVLKTAMGTTEFVDWQHFSSTAEAIIFLKEKRITVFALETTLHAKNISKLIFPQPTALIVGNEALGISKEILELADDIVSIPLEGWKNSLNVGVTAAIACYEISRQWNLS